MKGHTNTALHFEMLSIRSDGIIGWEDCSLRLIVAGLLLPRFFLLEERNDCVVASSEGTAECCVSSSGWENAMAVVAEGGIAPGVINLDSALSSVLLIYRPSS